MTRPSCRTGRSSPWGTTADCGGAATGPALARYNPDGSLDPTFGTGGKVVTKFSTGSGMSHARCVVAQPDGKIVAGVWGGFGDFALARYDTAGNLDPTFGQGGLATSNRPGLDGVEDLVLQPDGKIVAAGFVGRITTTPTPDDTAVTRSTPTGASTAASETQASRSGRLRPTKTEPVP